MTEGIGDEIGSLFRATYGCLIILVLLLLLALCALAGCAIYIWLHH